MATSLQFEALRIDSERTAQTIETKDGVLTSDGLGTSLYYMQSALRSSDTYRCEFHWPSQQAFNKIQILVPYNSAVFVCVRVHNIARELLRFGIASLEVIKSLWA